MVDHRDGNTLNNSRHNLRFCTASKNQANSKTRIDSSTGLRGVNFRKDSGKFRVRIQVDNKRLNLGVFDELEKAALVYKKAYIKHFGEFARI